jgi:hypothetical protein
MPLMIRVGLGGQPGGDIESSRTRSDWSLSGGGSPMSLHAISSARQKANGSERGTVIGGVKDFR